LDDKLYVKLYLGYGYVDEPQIGIKGALTSSRKLLHGQIWRLFCLQLSFVGWMLLTILSGLILINIYVISPK